MRRIMHCPRSLSLKAGLSFLLACAFLGLVPLASGQLQGSLQSVAITGPYRLSGTVVNSATGAPIRRALVQVYLGASHAMLTDGEGRFEFNDLPAGQTVVGVQKPGFFSEQDLGQRLMLSPPAMIEVGPEENPLVLKLVPEGIIFGRVDADGEPLENLPIKVIALRVVNGRKRWEQQGTATTDEDGSFRIANLSPGIYYIAAGPRQDFDPAAGKPRAAGGYSEVFYPDVPEIEAATPIEIVPGEQTEADLSLKAEQIYQVSGTVVGSATSRGVSLQFVNRSGESLGVPVQFDPKTGKFQTSIAAGSYTLRARAQDSDGSSWIADLPLTVAADVVGLRVVLGRGISIPVSVRTDYINPSARDMVVIGRGGPPVNIGLNSATTLLSAETYYASTMPNGIDQALAIRDVTPGKYSADINSSGEWYVASAQCGATDLLSDDLTILPGAHPPPVELVLRNDGATLTGSISSEGHPESGAVLLVAHHGKPRLTLADQGNGFQFSELAPGDYDVLAFDHADRLEYTNPEILNAYLGKATHVTLLANGKSQITVDLIHVEQP
jgi:hypothetical protein